MIAVKPRGQMSHPDVFMTLTCYHNLSPDFGQQITGYYRQNSSSRNTYMPLYAFVGHVWVLRLSRLSPSATQTPPGQLLSENSKKNNQKSKNPSMSISIKVVGIPQFLAPLAFLARKAPKKSRCSQSSNCRLLDLVEAKTAVCTSWPKYATVLKILPVQTQGQVSNMSNMSVHCYTYIWFNDIQWCYIVLLL
jgi:hypothetical protein